MCGIAGIIDPESGGAAIAEDVRRMCDAIAHRGPDDEGYLFEGRVALGMRRLSIIDLASGHQPIHNENGTVWVVFNGEIYNYRELRSDLEKRGHHFYTQTDTEVIVHLYEELDSGCVHKLRGMFAFAIFDQRQQRLLLARDRLGIKPLHYAALEKRFLFGSEIKALLAAEPDLAEVDREAPLHYFHFGYIPDPLSAFSRIRKLPPGHLLELDDQGLRISKYWDLPCFGSYEPNSEEELLDELEEELSDAVRLRLVSDVPLGALLSGGVDSSIVVALMARSTSSKIKTFSIGFPEDDFNESAFARDVAKAFGTDHHELVVEPRIWETLETLTRTLEEPFGDDSIVPTFHVSRMARQQVTVALSGDGGDEVFAGYDRYRLNLGRQLHDFVPGWLGRLYRDRVYPWLPIEFPGRRYLFDRSLPALERYISSLSTMVVGSRERFLFSEDFLSWTDGYESPFQRFRSFLEAAPAEDLLSKMQYLDMKTYLPDDILTKVDRMSMSTSLEVRVPMLDHVFVEWAVKLSPRWKFRHRQSKYILKKLGERIGVPHHVLYRQKRGFAMPLVHWWREELRSELLAILLERKTIERGYFDPKALRRLVQDHLSGRRDRSDQIWKLLVFELWHRNYLEPATARKRELAPSA